ncbi:hypothetical protein DYB32_009371 [Aphanomyces invadans]|uniref:Uncharacterized protein n=1 Tax=Aphanomyces invadans TaxID=157072 RepID=A0A3R7A307_9STRA|nr:hypothetical protein DYB32_009371 [Aphanomyces invadans]
MFLWCYPIMITINRAIQIELWQGDVLYIYLPQLKSMGKHLQKQLAWSTEMDLALLRQVFRIEPYDGEYGTLTLRWKKVATNLSACLGMEISHRSARDHYDDMLDAFKKTDKFQQHRGTGSEEVVSEQVLHLQDLVDRREARDEEKKARKEKEQI